ncbi:DUF4326 domain-containing protein [Salipiger mucosus]|nr:DUF4326 domain-containing protein [Salipiger mucosus]
MPRRIQMTRQRPWRRDHPDAVIVARPSKWGNPYRVGVHGDAARCVDLYRHAAQGGILNNFTGAPAIEELFAMQDVLRADLDELRGRDLACWCPVDGPCHGDVLLELANRRDG